MESPGFSCFGSGPEFIRFDHIDSFSVSVKIIVLFVFGIVLFVRFGLF